MGDATRKEFLRRIRVEAPDTGLRYVVEHLWLRGLLSGSIASSGSTTKNSTRPDKRKLEDALLAGQLHVKNLIETKWDGGVFSAGMASCSRTWLNQMLNVSSIKLVLSFFIDSCSDRHNPRRAEIFRDLSRSQLFLRRETFCGQIDTLDIG
jgi:hypothetical protein